MSLRFFIIYFLPVACSTGSGIIWSALSDEETERALLGTLLANLDMDLTSRDMVILRWSET